MKKRSSDLISSTILVLLSTALIFFFRLSLNPILGSKAASLHPFLISTMISTWYGGTLAGTLAALLGGVLGSFYFSAFSLTQFSYKEQTSIFVTFFYVLEAGINIILISELRKHRNSAEKLLKDAKLSLERRKEIEEELRTAKEIAETASIAKSAFLANMSHEIRTPLGAILGFAEILTSSDQNNLATTTQCYEIIKRNSHQLSTLINDILDLSKIEAGRLTVEKLQISLNDLLDDVFSGLFLQASKKNIALNLILDPNIPKKIMTDPVRLKQILINILGNAIKFTDEGQVTVHAKLSLPFLCIEISDTGKGLPKRLAHHLFEPFSQLDISSTKKYEGAGLGLALSRHLAQLLGGDLQLLRSEPGIGSSFVVMIDALQSSKSTWPAPISH